MALKILCLLSFVAFCNAGVLPLFDPRIVNGEDAKSCEIPYQVSLQYVDSSSHFCGGSILNGYYVITTAHCVQGEEANGIKVIAGTIDLTKPQFERRVVEVIVHGEYASNNSWINDIALLKVNDSLMISPTIGYVTLPPRGHVIKVNDIAVVSGWGWQGGPTTTKLQRVNILIADQAYCQYMYKNIGYNVYPTQVCAYDPLIEKGSCHGDSGGPLTVRGKLVGLVSWAYGCASTTYRTYPTVYTRVVSHLDWIRNHTDYNLTHF